MSGRVRFGEFEFDADSGELRREGAADGDVRRLPPQPARLLALLVERRGGLLSHDEIRDALWPDTAVDFDRSLHFCVRQVRAALDDSASEPRYVETLPRRGYRLLPGVRPIPVEPPRPAARGSRRRAIVAVALPALIALALATRGSWPSWPGGRDRPIRIGVMTFEPPPTLPFAGWRPVAEWILEELDATAGSGAALVGPTTTAAYAGPDERLMELGADYQLDYVVNGRFLDSEEGPRMLAELIRVSDGVHLWVQPYRDLRDGRRVGEEIAAHVARVLGLG